MSNEKNVQRKQPTLNVIILKRDIFPPEADITYESFIESAKHRTASSGNGEHTLLSSFVYMLIPGLFSDHGPLYFVGTKKFFSKMGLACHIAKIHSEIMSHYSVCIDD
ncbi:hypothetical protein L3X38_040088 [Prunus dulcis]|uniref:Uncharacterized protein n=1 Tax=Prunus dulcis TaxID=3755 RepID=A0AAD4YT33_PRUDU|nr:hypothetical protein L3X38_040088 [Prunus dulcis]